MISDYLRKLNSYLSFWCTDNQKVNITKDILIKDFIKKNLKNNKINIKNLKKTHTIFNKKIFLLLQNDNVTNFLREGFIQKMFFLHNRFFVYSELKVLKKDKKWTLYKKLINEDSIGNPIRYFLYPKSSGNRINHVYHLSILQSEFNIDLKEIKKVFEFGSGYGCMARIFSKISKDIKYTCFDTQYVNLLQYYYLKHCNLNVGFSNKSNFLLTSNLEKIKHISYSSKYLFIANWSLSETPILFRAKFDSLVKKSEIILISFQEKFEDIDNLKYFNNLKLKLSKNFNIKIVKNKFYNGNILNKQKHYFFVGKKL